MARFELAGEATGLANETSNDVAETLREWARRVALSRVLQELDLQVPPDAVLLVGSVASGLCQAGCDVDLVAVCCESEFDRISRGRPWAKGRPSEIHSANVQIHYYATTLGAVESQLDALDDQAFYVYGTARALSVHNPKTMDTIMAKIRSPELRQVRLEGRLDMLLRRVRALDTCWRQAEPLVLTRMSLEVVSLALKTTALLDDIPFDPRKRLMQTSLMGSTGRGLLRSFRNLILRSSAWGRSGGNPRFLAEIDEVVRLLSAKATAQGFKLGLPRPDPRATESDG